MAERGADNAKVVSSSLTQTKLFLINEKTFHLLTKTLVMDIKIIMICVIYQFGYLQIQNTVYLFVDRSDQNWA